MGELENRLMLIRDIAKDIKKYVGWWIALCGLLETR
jgi:hypothetical protein